jgi:hypothetical protein|tara:strand:+ start:153 stop:374 length:222 start_codon:yes stop_codon:yes gene_type:complete
MEDNLMDMIISDESPSNISDKIKDILFAKSAEKVDNFRPEVADSTFNSGEEEEEIETETPETPEASVETDEEE